jgi:hypothetical protein
MLSQPDGYKPKVREQKLRSGVNWQVAWKQKGVKRTGINKGCVYVKWLELWLIVLHGRMLVCVCSPGGAMQET